MQVTKKIELLLKQASKNMCCPKCGEPVVSAKDRIVKSFTLSSICPYCGFEFQNPIVTNHASLYTDVFLITIFKNAILEHFDVPVIIALPLIIALFVFCLTLTSIVFGLIGLLFFPLAEKRIRDTRGRQSVTKPYPTTQEVI